ncbi:MAG: alpha-galactosidase [Bacteroidales bacterium]|nr:alpha-galactosidase [Bacteroidales bacterium]MCF8389322.1 alpha-galactosidase [Bacteroidales bacterium]
MKLLFSIAIAFFVSTLSASELKDVKLFILSGQSNALGAGNAELLSEQYKTRNSEILIFENGQWREMSPYARKAEKFNIEKEAFGAELSFAYEMKKRFPNYIIAVSKVAVAGGTSIVAWDKDIHRENWMEDLKEVANEDKAKLKLYDKLINDTKESIASLLEKANVNRIELSGMLWLQTERDGKTPETIKKYAPRLKALINNIRKDLDAPELPFLIMDAHINRQNLSDHQKMLTEVQKNIIGVRIIKSDDLPSYEGVHFNSEGVMELGKRFAQSYFTYFNAPKPPMGWNSFDSYGVYLYEDAAMANLESFAEKLKPHGYEYFVIDAGWFGEFKLKEGTMYPLEKHAERLKFNEYGLLQPSDCYFPNGLKPIIDRSHELGLKFGLHLMRGIPREAVRQNTRIEGTKYYAQDIVDTTSICVWNHQNYGIDMTKPGSQEFYNSLINQLAEWGVDFIKYDDIVPYPKEVEAVVNAIAQCGRPMVLSLSPGGSVDTKALDFFKKANMLRVTKDIWDEQEGIDECFEAWHKWQGKDEPGFWIDMDMIPFGQLQLMSPKPEGVSGHETKSELQAKISNGELKNLELLSGKGWTRWSSFSKDQMYTFISLRALSASPLMMGGDLPSLDDFSLKLITNRDMLECNQNGVMGSMVYEEEGVEIWKSHSLQSDKGWLGVFNRNSEAVEINLSLEKLGLDEFADYKLKNIWEEKNLKLKKGQKINSEGVIFISYSKK